MNFFMNYFHLVNFSNCFARHLIDRTINEFLFVRVVVVREKITSFTIVNIYLFLFLSPDQYKFTEEIFNKSERTFLIKSSITDVKRTLTTHQYILLLALHWEGFFIRFEIVSSVNLIVFFLEIPVHQFQMYIIDCKLEKKRQKKRCISEKEY